MTAMTGSVALLGFAWSSCPGVAGWIPVIFLLCSAIQISIFCGVFSRLISFRDRRREGIQPASTNPSLPSVSVVLCARNEAVNLRNNLPSLSAQEYADWELVLVDDGSTDGSSTWLQEWAEEQNALRPKRNIRIICLPDQEKTRPGKRVALDRGIRASKGDWILLTDADCRPDSPHWISQMMAQVERDTDFILGYGGYAEYPGWLNRIIQFETLHTLLQYTSWALAGMPYMGVGRNLAYRRSVYVEGGGLTEHLWPSGDDDLFVNALARTGRVALCLDPSGWTQSEPPRSWKEWVKQKRRHLSTGVFYRPLHRTVLGIYAMSHFGTYVTFFVAWALCGLIPWMWALLALRLLVWNGLFYHLSRRFARSHLWYFSTIFDFLAVAYYARFVGSTLFPKLPSWR